MRHKVKNKRFGFGQDANEMLRRKLLSNFLMHGKITTTEAKAKFLKGLIDKMVTLGKKDTIAATNVLLSYIGNSDIVAQFKKDIVPQLKDRTSGYTKSARLLERENDGVVLMKLHWSSAVVYPSTKKVVEEKPKAAKIEQKASGKEVNEPAVKKEVVKEAKKPVKKVSK